MCSKGTLNRACEWWITRPGNLFAVENNCISLGKQLLVVPAGCALAAPLWGTTPSDLPPNFACLEELSWVNAPGRKLPLFICIPSVSRSPGTVEMWWKESSFYTLRCKIGWGQPLEWGGDKVAQSVLIQDCHGTAQGPAYSREFTVAIVSICFYGLRQGASQCIASSGDIYFPWVL